MGPILSLDISIVHIAHCNASKASCLLWGLSLWPFLEPQRFNPNHISCRVLSLKLSYFLSYSQTVMKQQAALLVAWVLSPGPWLRLLYRPWLSLIYRKIISSAVIFFFCELNFQDFSCDSFTGVLNLIRLPKYSLDEEKKCLLIT